MGVFILIAVLTGTTQPLVVEFNSKTACYAAMVEVKKQTKTSSETFCVAKGNKIDH